MIYYNDSQEYVRFDFDHAVVPKCDVEIALTDTSHETKYYSEDGVSHTEYWIKPAKIDRSNAKTEITIEAKHADAIEFGAPFILKIRDYKTNNNIYEKQLNWILKPIPVLRGVTPSPTKTALNNKTIVVFSGKTKAINLQDINGSDQCNGVWNIADKNTTGEVTLEGCVLKYTPAENKTGLDEVFYTLNEAGVVRKGRISLYVVPPYFLTVAFAFSVLILLLIGFFTFFGTSLSAADDEFVVNGGETQRINILANDRFQTSGVNVNIIEPPTIVDYQRDLDNKVSISVPEGTVATSDRFVYSIEENGSLSQAEVLLTIIPMPLFDLKDDTASFEMNTAIEVEVVSNDIIPSNDFKIKVTKQPNKGRVVVVADKIVKYIPLRDVLELADQVVKYQVKLGSRIRTAELTLSMVAPDPILAVDDYIELKQGESKNVEVLANDTILAGQPDITIVNNPIHGKLAYKPGNIITYTANDDATGVDSFTYRVTVGQQSDEAKVNIQLIESISPPSFILSPDVVTLLPGEEKTVSVLDNDNLTAQVVNDLNLEVIGNSSRLVRATPNPDKTITVSLLQTATAVEPIVLTYKVSVNNRVASTTLTITSPSKPIKAVNDEYTLMAGQPESLNVVLNDQVPNDFDLKIIEEPIGGDASRKDGGVIEVTLAETAHTGETYQMEYEISDGIQSSRAVVTIHVGASSGNTPVVNPPVLEEAISCLEMDELGALFHVPAGTYKIDLNSNHLLKTVAKSDDRYEVTLEKDMCIQSKEVSGNLFNRYSKTLTTAQKEAYFLGAFPQNSRPVGGVSKENVDRYIAWLNNQMSSSYTVSLPNKSQWVAALIHSATMGKGDIFDSLLDNMMEMTAAECSSTATFVTLGRLSPSIYENCASVSFGSSLVGFRTVVLIE
jgi:hypothetical protein